MTALILLLLTPFTMAKRATPPNPIDIVRSGVEYSVQVSPLVCKEDDKTQCHEEVLVSAKNKISGEDIWKTMILQVNFAPGKETDVQLILPTSLKLLGKHQIIIIMEDQTRFMLNAKTGDMIRPSKTAILESKAASE